MVPVEFDDGYLNVIGYTCKPLYAKSSRSFQIFFINGRYVRSRVCSVAVESAYENLIMTGKFPSCVLMISVNASDIDVNVHPTKAEVRFTNEKNVADGLYFSIKNALMQSGLIYEFRIHPPKPVTDWTAPVPETSVFSQPPLPEIPIPVSSPVEEYVSFESVMSESNGTNNISITSPIEKSEPAVKIEDPYEYKDVFVDVSDIELEETENTATDISHDEVYIEKRSESLPNDTTYEKTDNISHLSEIKNEASDIDIRVVGEIFKNYIIAEAENNIVIFDKHAAHERVIFEKLRAGTAGYSRQMLMTPVKLLLSTEEADALQNNGKLLSGMGFSFDFESTPNVLVTGVPTFALNLNIDEIVTEIARNIVLGKANPNPSYLDDTFHSIACKAAIKANDKNDLIELQKLAHEVYNNENIRHCPHGRPVMFVITKHELEKQFRRI